MASGMKQWLALVFSLLLVAGVGSQAVPAYGSGPRGRFNPETERFLELEGDLARQSWLYKRIQWRDSLVQELLERIPEVGPVVLGLPEEARDSVWDSLTSAVESQLSSLGREEPAMPLGLFVFPRSQGAHPEGSPTMRGIPRGLEYFLARDGEPPFCAIGAPYQETGRDSLSPGYTDPIARQVRYLSGVTTYRRAIPNPLGICRYFVRYGEPGQEMMAWLRGGAAQYAEAVFEIDHHLRYAQGPARGPFGVFRRAFPARTTRCLSGEEDDCLGLILEPQLPLSSPGRSTRGVEELIPESPVDFLARRLVSEEETRGLGRYLFHSLEEEFGPDRFRDFWQSDLPPDAAFQESFGEPLGPWIRDWLLRYLEPSARGPGVPIQATFLTLLSLGILAGGAVRMGRR